jgi:pantoate--beta-alanine ligase
MKTIRTIAELQHKLAGHAVGLVPTMGALHAGHRSLFEAARAENDFVVASLFVNSAQFGEQSDLDAYPRDEENDALLAQETGVDVLFAPSTEEIYPSGFGTWIDVDDAGAEGAAREGHFRGVATVCVKLFNIVRPVRAYFGQKDAQQAVVVRRVVRELHLPVQIRVLPTVRDADGLALSSRNARLSPAERASALALPAALARGAEMHRLGGDAVAATRAALNGLTPEYVELVELDGVTLLATAARIGDTRLIDNVILEGELS